MRAGSKHVVSRRAFLQTGVASVLALESTSWVGASTMEQSRSSGTPSHPELKSVKALVFDVFGTVVDWRSSVAREVDALARKKSLKVDGAAFADAWRAQYAPMMDRVRTGKLPWTKLDRLHRMILDDIVGQFGFGGLTEAERSALNLAWHRLQPWPDAVPGLTRLKKRFILAPLSNGNISLMTDLARHAGLPWDCILGAELVRHYKPDPEVYQSAAELLDLDRAGVMMVAAHLNDLKAAKAQGLRTAFVPRPREYGPARTPDLAPDASVDLTAPDFVQLAAALGA
jgi:2-haloacid dehalogenase